MSVDFELRPAAPRSAAGPELDDSQRAVLDHEGGPLLVLAGPGTGKTTTLVELVADRVNHRGIAAERILILTFSRKATQEIGNRIAYRLGGAGRPVVRTFHSLCFGLVTSLRRDTRDALRLVSAPEQVARIQELLEGHRAENPDFWPPGLQKAAQTQGFARELADFLGRAASVGVDGTDIAHWSHEHNISDWRALARFMDEYEQVFSLAGEADYSSLVVDAVSLLSDPETGEEQRNRFDLIVVDEYQDTDPAQVRLLQLLSDHGHKPLVAVGDPDQSIYAFRGADVGGIWRFAHDFGSAESPASTLALQHTRRFGQTLLDASRAVIAPLGITGRMDAQQFHAFRHPQTKAEDPGQLEVYTYASASAEAESIAQLIRRAHLDDGLPYDSMAVLTRTAGDAFGRISRALIAAGIPVEVAGDEIPLAEQPAVGAIAAAADLAQAMAQQRDVSIGLIRDVLLGPLGGLDAGQLRRYVRHLRDAQLEELGQARPSDEFLVSVVTGESDAPESGNPRTAEIVERVNALIDLLSRTSALIAKRVPAEMVLWALWSGTSWPRRLQHAAETGGDAARAAHRDLDAIGALFDRAARDAEGSVRRGIGVFLHDLASQEIPGDSLADTGIRPASVRVMTAHRSKGLEWPLVVVAGVNEGVWPNLQVRGTLLGTESLGPAGPQPPQSVVDVQREERRLFYVATTRASSRLVVTAVEAPGEDGDQPSRFVDELAALPFARQNRHLPRPGRTLSLRGSVATLRRMAETGSTPRVRAEAAQRLAALVDVVPEAAPERWWGLPELTVADVPVRDPEEPLALSGSAISRIDQCALSWFLAREAKAETASGAAQVFGSVVHVITEVSVFDEKIDITDLLEKLDTVWDRIPYDAEWIRESQRREAHAAVQRYVTWHERNRGRTPIKAELQFEVPVPVGSDTVLLRGFMDRVELDTQGRVHIVDFKTGKNPPTNQQVADDAQLGTYQLAIEHGAAPGYGSSGGAELVHLRKPAGAKDPDAPKVQGQGALSDAAQPLIREQLHVAVDRLRAENYVATPSAEACQHCGFQRLCPAKPQGVTVVDGAP